MPAANDADGELSPPLLARLCAKLGAGQVLACPTETQMGLLADATRGDAIDQVCALKGRPDNAPLALLLPDRHGLELVSTGLASWALALADAHWPGPLTLLVPAQPHLDPRLTKDGRVGVRVPGPSAALTLVRAFGGPLTATSANLSGHAVVPDGAAAAQLFGEGIGGVVPGSVGGTLPSTIVDVSGAAPQLVRSGALRLEGLG